MPEFMCVFANLLHIAPCKAVHHARLALYIPLYKRDCRKQQEMHLLHMRDELSLYPEAFWRTRVADALQPPPGKMNVSCLLELRRLSEETSIAEVDHGIWTYQTKLAEAHVECGTQRAWMVKVGLDGGRARRAVLVHERGHVPVVHAISDDKTASKELGADHVAHMLTLRPNEHSQLHADA
jgi:hypothetical protein